MTQRISVSNVEAIFRAACVAAREAGFDPTGWTLSHGSATNGVGWDLVRPGGSRQHLGFARTDVHNRLSAYREAWLMVAAMRDGSDHV